VGIGIFRSVSSAFDADAGDGAYRYAATLGAYGAVITGHTFCCWKAASVLRFDTLNRARLCRMTRAFVDAETLPSSRDGSKKNDDALVSLPGVDAAGKEEGVYRARFAADAPTLGASLPECARDWEDLEVLMTLSRESVSRYGCRRSQIRPRVGQKPKRALRVARRRRQAGGRPRGGARRDQGVGGYPQRVIDARVSLGSVPPSRRRRTRTRTRGS
jgi:hypothetical protein